MLYPDLVVNSTYKVVREIGAGGMGVVYLAYHLRLDKYIVMKKIKNSSASLSVIRNEADVLKSLHHTYLPQVYDFIQYDGDTYTIIDYIEGYDLMYYIENGLYISESQLIKWLKQLCEVLQYLHTHTPKILHADIKPANIIIQPSGDVCLIDFGISMLGNAQMKGISYEYSSPEQYYNLCCIRAGNYDAVYTLDDRTDIYSLGTTFYQIMTAMKPSCLYELPPVEDNLYLPASEGLCKIINKAVSFDRGKRFSSAAQMHKALNDIYKLSSKYKTYILTQVAASFIACSLIVLGAVTLMNGLYNNIKRSFEEDYNAYIAALSANNLSRAASSAQKLINQADYESLMDESTTAEVYRGLGDCYYENGDYTNAVACYENAVNNTSEESISEALYRNYAMTLAQIGQIDKAEQVLEKLDEKYPNSASGKMIRAQLANLRGNHDEALELVSEILSLPVDRDTRYAAYILKGDVYEAMGEWESADEAYLSAYTSKDNPSALRKRGAVELRLAVRDHSDRYYLSALECFKVICEHYTPTEDDVLNLGQCYLYSSVSDGAEQCIKLMKEYMDENSDSFRCCVLLAVAGDTAQDAHTADFCRRAHKCYLSMSQSEKEQADSDSLRKIRTLYRKYTGEEW